MERVFFQVTEGDIQLGIPRNKWNCPVALALKRKLKLDLTDVVVGGDIVIILGVKKGSLSQRVSDWILEFDFRDERVIEPIKGFVTFRS